MRIRPSKLSQLALCPKFDMVLNEEVTSSGTLIHDACATNIVTGLSDEDKLVVEGALAFAEQQKASLTGPVRDFVEASVHCKALNLGGKIDRLLVGSDGKAIVIDWKTGPAGLPDDADDSLQVLCYMLGVLDSFADVNEVLGVLTNPRTKSLSADLRVSRASAPWVVERLRKVIERAEDPFASPCTGSHCAKCQHAARCPALVPTIREAAAPMISGVAEIFQDPAAVNPSPPMRAARALVRMVLDRWSEAVKDDDNAYLKAGNEPPPGFKKMVRSTGLRIPENSRLSALRALRDAGIDDDVVAAGCNIALGKIIEALTLVTGDKKVATTQVHGAVTGIAVEGNAEYMARDKKAVSDESLFKAIREAIGPLPKLIGDLK